MRIVEWFSSSNSLLLLCSVFVLYFSNPRQVTQRRRKSCWWWCPRRRFSAHSAMKLVGVALRGVCDGGLSRQYGPSCLVRTLCTNTNSAMKLVGVALRGVCDGGLSRRYGPSCLVRTLCTNTNSGDTFESADDFEKRIFGGVSSNGPNADPFFQKLDRLERSRGRSGFGSRMNANETGGNTNRFMDGMDENISTLSDGMDGTLKNAARYFEFDPEEVKRDDYSFRPDVTFPWGTTYDVKDLDLRRPGVRKPFKRQEFETTTEEVLRKADFRNVRFLANFLTDAGIIIKRSTTKISAKAQRKVAREIKTARAFGLMPFTTMGEDRFIFGKSRENPYDDEPVSTRRRGSYAFTRMTEDRNDENEADEPEINQMESSDPI